MRRSIVQIGSTISRISAAPLSSSSVLHNAIPKDPMVGFKELADRTEKKPRVLITGGLGQLGKGLANAYRYMYGRDSVLMTDIVKGPVDNSMSPYFYLDIMNQSAIEEAIVNGQITTIVHFSALLSAVGENNVPLALKVNGQGVQNILEAAKNHKVQVFIPSTIGAFGPSTPRKMTPDLCIQRPRTIYGVTKVYAELLGEYYHERFGVDFRSLRFPGIISAMKPGGGTTDYAIQIFYDALMYGKHKCYLRPDTELPMMYDTDCTASVIYFLAVPEDKLKQRTYNITGFSFTPEEIAAAVKKVMPEFKIEYEVCPIRQKIADSWPQSLDDSAAKKDWGWHPDYDMDATVQIMFDLVKRQLADEQRAGKTTLKV